MATKIVEIEAESLEEARNKIGSQIPEGFRQFSEEIISDGKPRTVTAFGVTTEGAFKQALSQVPSGVSVSQKKEVVPPEHSIIIVEAFDEHTATSEAWRQACFAYGHRIVKSVKLLIAGRRGFLGVGKKPNKYEAEILQEAVVEITYTLKPKISFKLLDTEGLEEQKRLEEERQRIEKENRLAEEREFWESMQNTESWKGKLPFEDFFH